MESDLQALEEMGFLHMFSHYCESTLKTFGPLRTYRPPLLATFADNPSHAALTVAAEDLDERMGRCSHVLGHQRG